MSNHNDPAIPQGAQAVLELFEGELSGLKFADVDRKVLTEAADEVRARAEEVRRAEAVLQAAREALQEGQDNLLHKCQRGLAYARIYAEEDADLTRRLEAISLPRKGGRGAPQGEKEAPEPRPQGRRGRPKSGAAATGLFLEVGTAPAVENGVAH